jgi:Protein of unknown function (DUF3095)
MAAATAAAVRHEGGFYAGLPVFEGFSRILEPGLYTGLPGGWWLGVADVVGSTEAIRAGGYKDVNMAGAAVIAAVKNALAGRDLPFVFGGDGASFAVAGEDAAAAGQALAATVAWVGDELGLSLRAAMIPVAAVRAAGHDVRIARFAASAQVSYAMFAGGGLAWAEQQLKLGGFAVPPAPEGTRPDLTGLSCRWEAIASERGTIVSLLVTPAADAGGYPAGYAALVGRLLALVEEAGGGRPVSDAGLRLRWPPEGLGLEARAARRAGQRLIWRRLSLACRTLLAYLVFRFELRVGRFDPAHYRRDLISNADFRKYDDGVRMTLDCTPELARAIEALLAAAAQEGSVRYGLHRQDAALMTCFVPSIHDRGHLHFVDGADGGYAAAAVMLKASPGPDERGMPTVSGTEIPPARAPCAPIP